MALLSETAKREIEAEAKVADALCKYVRALRESSNPQVAVASARWGKLFAEELAHSREQLKTGERRAETGKAGV